MANAVDDHPNRDQLVAFLWGHLSGADLASLSRHIESCETCCLALRDIPDDAFAARLRDASPSPTEITAETTQAAARDQKLPAELLNHPRYKIGRSLGAGGMGVVYQAEHRLMDRTVALKIVHRDLIRNPRALERFRLEFKAAARLSHPNIVTAFDAEQAGDVHFLVMEFVDGMSLANIVGKKGPLDVIYACNFVRQAAKGLQHAFEAGMVHRDIKPHNLMLTRKGQIKILDFGLARLASESRAEPASASATGSDLAGLTRLGDVMGTPEYMAPEQISDPHKADIRADIYSLGCTLFYLITGEPPFKDESPMGLLFSQRHKQPPTLSDVRPDTARELSTLVAKMLAKEPAQRFATPAEIVKALAPFVKPPPALPPKAAVVSEPPPARSEVLPSPAPPRPDPNLFQARCPFCAAGVRLPQKALGASIPCPHCSSYFTAVPMDDACRS